MISVFFDGIHDGEDTCFAILPTRPAIRIGATACAVSNGYMSAFSQRWKGAAKNNTERVRV